MVPGSSIAFSVRKDALDAPHVLSYASKSEGMFVRESLIFRCAPGAARRGAPRLAALPSTRAGLATAHQARLRPSPGAR
jgi:hypothetical protein